jgi:hypothetical protein
LIPSLSGPLNATPTIIFTISSLLLQFHPTVGAWVAGI